VFTMMTATVCRLHR